MRQDRPDLTFDNEVGALHAVHSAVMDAGDGDSRFSSVAPVVDRVRRFIVQRRVERRAADWTPGIGGKRRLPGQVWAALRRLSRIPGNPHEQQQRLIAADGLYLFSTAERIRRADDGWRAWEDCRRRTGEPGWMPETDGSWQFPKSRSLYFSTWAMCSDINLLLDELDRAPQRPRARDWYQKPDITADGKTWTALLNRRWRYQVRHEHDHDVVDAYHIRLDAVRRSIELARRACDDAAGELNQGEVNPTRQFTTRFVVALDGLGSTVPNRLRDGDRMPVDPGRTAEAIRKRLKHMSRPMELLRALAYQRRPGRTQKPNGPPSENWRRVSGADLAIEAGISQQTFRRIRDAAALSRGERGGLARLRSYTPEEVAAMIDVVELGSYLNRRAIVEAWKPFA